MNRRQTPYLRPFRYVSMGLAVVLALLSVPAGSLGQSTADDAMVRQGKETKAPAKTGERRLPDTPSLVAVSGLYHLVSAQTGDPMTFRLALTGQYVSSEDVVRARDENTRFIGNVALSMTATPWLEPYAAISARSNRNTFSVPETVLAQGDLTFGAKGVYPVAKAFYVGGDLRIIALTGAGETAFDFGGTSVKMTALATFDARELPQPAPVRGHFNIGYFIDNSDQLLPEDDDGAKLIPSRVDRFAQNMSAYDQFQIGIGVDAPLPYVTPHLEYNIGILAGQEPAALCDETQPLPCPSDAGFGSNPQILTLGVKGTPLPGLILNGGIDIGVTSKDTSGVPATAPWNLIFGLSYVFDPRPRVEVVERFIEDPTKGAPAPKVGFVKGTLVDLDTGEAVGDAKISYPGGDRTRQSSDVAGGTFTSYDFPPGGTVEIAFEHPEYQPKTIQQQVVEGENVVRIELKPIGKTGHIAGTVLLADGLPANTNVVMTGPKSYEVKLRDGRFSQKVLVGAYTVSASMSGHLTDGKDIVVTAGATSKLDLSLPKRPPTAVVNIQSDKILIEGGIPFKGAELTPKANAVLDQVFATLVEHPEFTRVRIESHVAGKGKRRMGKQPDPKVVTQARAKAVMDYLNQKGISGDRLEAKGYGSSQPLVPEISERNRAINERVELTIISRAGK